jgi:hypothetical protein
MRLHFDANPQPMEDFRTFDHACTVLEAYNKHYQKEPFSILLNSQGKPIVEASFALPFGTIHDRPIYYSGKIDLGIQDNAGVWVFDTKTAFMYGEAWEASMQMDSGQLGYVWALRQVLPPSIRVNGYIINGIRIRRPKKGDEYNAVAPVDASDFTRLVFHVHDDILDEWRENTCHAITEIFRYHAQDYYPMRRSQCVTKFGKCDMFDVCSVGMASRESALYSNMYEENTWTPLKTNDE